VVNNRIKGREDFRPFAPAIVYEHLAEYVELEGDFRYMSYSVPIIYNKLGEIPAVVHIDNTARVQAVKKEADPLFHSLICAFSTFSGVPVIMNTSFNLAKEPIVETPEDALSTFLRSGMDCLCIGNYLLRKTRA
jgi:carbamoyltransferase